MENKNLIAAQGLKKIRIAQILSIIAVCLISVGGIIFISGAAVAGGNATVNEVLAVGGLGAAGIGGLMTIAGIIIALVSAVMEIVGIVKTRSAHPSYKMALYMILVNIALGALGFIVSGNLVLMGILQTISPAVVFLTVYFVISGTIALLREKGDEATAAQGVKIRNIYLGCTAVNMIGELVLALPFLTAVAGVASVATMISAVVQVVALFMYIGFLGRSVQSLSK